MKKTSSILLLVLALVIVSFTMHTVATVYKVDTAKSMVKWTGKKVTGEHTGNIKISSGSITWDNKTIKSGSFDIDMTSITCTDLTDKEYNAKLVGHLKAEDFFGVAKHPKATFVITSAVSKGNDTYEITGNLTIKGVTKPVTFPATVKTDAAKLTAKATILVDRTKYDIKYGSSSFFDNLGDKAIDNDFALDIDIVANK